MRVVAAVLTFTGALVSPLAIAQEWSVYSGVAAGTEYTDNYFLSADNQQSAFTGSVAPFVFASRRTDTSDLAALLAIGANKVWGQVSTSEYWSGRLALNGSLRNARSTWSGKVSFLRTPSFQTTADNLRTELGLAYTNTSAVSAAYSYDVTEEWSLAVNVAGYNNNYTSAGSDVVFEDNHGYTARATATYLWSDRTRIESSVDYLHNISHVSTDDTVTGTVRVVHRFSPQLTTWLSAGAFWAKNKTQEQTTVPASTRPRQSDGLFGGGVAYDLSERSNVLIAYSKQVAPTGTGFISRDDKAAISLIHRYSDRLTGRVGAGYSNTDANKYYRAEIGASYAFAERWTLQLAYRNTRARSPDSPQSQSNGAFVSVAYNWPGVAFTDWTGRSPDMTGAAGTGPLMVPSGQLRPSTPPSDDPSERSLFGPVIIP
jgi:hypothetical protein